jgi:hypothetical protein
MFRPIKESDLDDRIRSFLDSHVSRLRVQPGDERSGKHDVNQDLAHKRVIRLVRLPGSKTVGFKAFGSY